MLNPPRVFIDDSPESIENSVFTQTWYPDVDHVTWCGKWRNEEFPHLTLDETIEQRRTAACIMLSIGEPCKDK